MKHLLGHLQTGMCNVPQPLARIIQADKGQIVGPGSVGLCIKSRDLCLGLAEKLILAVNKRGHSLWVSSGRAGSLCWGGPLCQPASQGFLAHTAAPGNLWQPGEATWHAGMCGEEPFFHGLS